MFLKTANRTTLKTEHSFVKDAEVVQQRKYQDFTLDFPTAL